MRLDAFRYNLPESAIAQRPDPDRSGSRLLVVDRRTGDREHARFRDMPGYLSAGDVVVVNRSRVIPARIFVNRESGGKVELLVSEITGRAEFVAIGSPLRRLRPGDLLHGYDAEFTCEVDDRAGDRAIRIRITSGESVKEVLDRAGHVPLPPYIDRPDEAQDRARYQTVFAREEGSAAAPTAGLHFDELVIGRLAERGVELRSLVLHVGLGTFLPLAKDVVEDNKLHAERYTIDADTVGAIRRAKSEGRRVVAVGTTVTRVLETLSSEILAHHGKSSKDLQGRTKLFIYPGYEFKIIDALVTNFHLPGSSLLVLVCAFLGRERTLECYKEAVDNKYRFYSYGDAMFVR